MTKITSTVSNEYNRFWMQLFREHFNEFIDFLTVSDNNLKSEDWITFVISNQSERTVLKKSDQNQHEMKLEKFVLNPIHHLPIFFAKVSNMEWQGKHQLTLQWKLHVSLKICEIRNNVNKDWKRKYCVLLPLMKAVKRRSG